MDRIDFDEQQRKDTYISSLFNMKNEYGVSFERTEDNKGWSIKVDEVYLDDSAVIDFYRTLKWNTYLRGKKR